jgi:hypothetical protein
MKYSYSTLSVVGLFSLAIVGLGQSWCAYADDDALLRLTQINEKYSQEYKDYKVAVRTTGVRPECACLVVEAGPESVPVYTKGEISMVPVPEQKPEQDRGFLYQCLRDALNTALPIREDCPWRVIVAFDNNLMFQEEKEGLVLFPVVKVFVLDTRDKLIVDYYPLGQKGPIDQGLLERVCAASAQSILRPPKKWWLDRSKKRLREQ